MIKKILTNDKRFQFDGAHANPSVQVYEGGAYQGSRTTRPTSGQYDSIMPRKGSKSLSR